MKVSIITVTYNSGKTIADTIESVLSQTYPNIEYLIIDGLSKDNTLDIVNSYGNRIQRVISEPDEGIYDAINKGLHLATGDVIGILNSDDIYANKYIIAKMVAQMKAEEADTLYGDLKYVHPEKLSKTQRYWKSGKYNRKKFLYGWMPPHPTFFVKREIYKLYGDFDKSLDSAADYELMLRFLYKHKVSATYLPEVMVLMRTGGKSNASLWNRLRGNKQDKLAWIRNDLSANMFTTIMKPIRKLPQFILS